MSINCVICGLPSAAHSYTSHDFLYNNKEINYDYARCSECKAEFIYPMPDGKTIANFYPDEYMVYQQESIKPIGKIEKAVLAKCYGYDHLQVPAWAKLFAPIISKYRYRESIRFQKNGVMLDIGCGNGKYLSFMSQIGWKAKGIEMNSKAVSVCRERRLDVFEGDLHQAKISNNSIDLITARHLLEHLSNPHEFMIELARIIKKGGILHIRTPNTDALGRKDMGIYWYANDVPRHLILYCKDTMEALMSKHGFTLVEFRTSSTPKIYLNSLDYKTGNKGTPSKKNRQKRLMAKSYVRESIASNRGDEIYATYQYQGS